MLEFAKILGTGLAITGLIGAGVGVAVRCGCGCGCGCGAILTNSMYQFITMFMLAVLIGGLEWSRLEIMEIALRLIASFFLLGLNYEMFLKTMKEKVNRLIKDKTKRCLDLSKLPRVHFLFPFFLFSIKSSLFLFTVGYLYTKGFIPGIRYCCNLDEDFSWMIFLIILIVGPQVSLICFFLNQTSLWEKFYLICYIISLRIILINILILFVSGYYPVISEELLLILSTGIFSVVCESGILDKLPLLYFKSLLNIPLNLYGILDKWIKCLIYYYKASFLKSRMQPFNSRFPLYNKNYSSFIYRKMFLFKGKILDMAYYPSQFQSFTLPQVYPSSAELTLNNIFGSPILIIILNNDYFKFQTTGQVGKSWYLMRDLMESCGRTVLNPQSSPWDCETLVGSDWDSETVVGCEFDIDLIGNCLTCSKLKDPQLNFSPGYLEVNRVQTVYINEEGKGKEIQYSLDNNNSLGNNSEGLSAEVNVTEPRFIDFVSGRLSLIGSINPDLYTYDPVIINELWRDYIEGEYYLPIRSLDFITSYNLEDQRFLSFFQRNFPNMSLDSLYPYQIQRYWDDNYVLFINLEVEMLDNSSIDEELSDTDIHEWAGRLANSLDMVSEKFLNTHPIPSNDSSSPLSSIDSEDLLGLELELELESFFFSQSKDKSPDKTNIWDYDLAKCEGEFRSFMKTIKIDDIFDLNLFNEYIENSTGGESIDSYQNLDTFDLSDADLGSGQVDLDSDQDNLVVEERNSPYQEARIRPSLAKGISKNKQSNINHSIKTTKKHKNKYYEMSYLLSARKYNLKASINKSKIMLDKRTKLAKVDIKYKNIRESLRNIINDDQGLENMRGVIENFSEDILGVRRRQGYKVTNELMGDKKDIFGKIGTIKSQITRHINKSNLDDKDTKLKLLKKKIEKLRSLVWNDSNSAHDVLKNKVYRTLHSLSLDFHFARKWAKGMRDNFLIPKNKDLYLLFLLFYNIRKDLIKPFTSALTQRIKQASLPNKDDIYSEFLNEIFELKKQMYLVSDLDNGLHLILRTLIKLNYKYNYYQEATIYNWNIRIYTTLKKIVGDIIKSKKDQNPDF